MLMHTCAELALSSSQGAMRFPSFVFVVTLAIIMGKRGSSSSTIDHRSSTLDKQARKDLRCDLMASSRATKTSVATVLQTLHNKGLLKDVELGAGNESVQLSKAVAQHAAADTPYGKVVQVMELDTKDGPMNWISSIRSLSSGILHHCAQIMLRFSPTAARELGISYA